MNELETKQAIVGALKSFADKPIATAAIALFESLGYRSEKRITLKPNTENFHRHLRQGKAAQSRNRNARGLADGGFFVPTHR